MSWPDRYQSQSLRQSCSRDRQHGQRGLRPDAYCYDSCNHARPLSVSRYFWSRLVGLLGMVYAMHPCSSRFFIERLNAPVFVPNRSNSTNSDAERGPSVSAVRTARDWAPDWAPDWALDSGPALVLGICSGLTCSANPFGMVARGCTGRRHINGYGQFHFDTDPFCDGHLPLALINATITGTIAHRTTDLKSFSRAPTSGPTTGNHAADRPLLTGKVPLVARSMILTENQCMLLPEKPGTS